MTAALLGAAAWALGLVLLLDGAAGGWFIVAGALLLILSWRGTFGMWFEGLVTGGVPPDPVSGRPDPLDADTRSSGEERS